MSNKMALDALKFAEAALADIGDADREPGDDLAWCEARAAEALPRTRAAIAALQAEPQGWRPIETAPVNTQVVALFRGERPVIAHKNAPNDSPAGWCHAFATRDYFDHPTRGLTHWMPLPTPPKD